MNILNSATRIALLLIIVSLVGLTSFVVISNSKDQAVITSMVWLFSTTAVAITSFYFGQKQKSQPSVDTNSKTEAVEPSVPTSDTI